MVSAALSLPDAFAAAGAGAAVLSDGVQAALVYVNACRNNIRVR
jgi:hypothetical protein